MPHFKTNQKKEIQHKVLAWRVDMVDLLDEESNLNLSLLEDAPPLLGKRGQTNISFSYADSSVMANDYTEKRLKGSLTNEIQGLINKGKLQSKP